MTSLALALWLAVASVLLHTPTAETCTDNDPKIVELAKASGEKGVSGCADIAGLCGATGQKGVTVRKWCCASCKTGSSIPSSLPPADKQSPVQLFLLSGQSECTGSADSAVLNGPGKTAYPLLAGTQTGVWFACMKGFDNSKKRDFSIAPMKAGDEKSNFGPEISFGQRIHEVTGARVMVVKYCRGGSSTAVHWNPSTSENSWDHGADNGTAAWLKSKRGVDFKNKNSLFVNLVYVVRLATEALKTAGVAYEWKSIVWVQGSADKKDTWDVFGKNTARLFDAIRQHAVGTWNLPIVDTGSSAMAALRTGKAYAGQLVKGCKVTTVEMGMAAADPDSTCVPGPSNPCSESVFMNPSVMNHYGWDPNMPENLRPPNASDKKFSWYHTFPTNMHSAYEGMILKGRMLADEYIRAFTPTPLPKAMAVEDPALKFPFPMCATATKPTAKLICWMDQRGAVQASKTCVPQPPPGAPSTSPKSTSPPQHSTSPPQQAASTSPRQQAASVASTAAARCAYLCIALSVIAMLLMPDCPRGT